MKYLAVDYGNKRTGLALCDRNETMASPLSVISEPSRVIQVIVEVVEELKAGVQTGTAG